MGKVIAFIFVRGGSKGLPGKNLLPLGGVSLLGRAVSLAKQCDLIDRVIISTDSPELAEEGKCYGAEIPFMRPAELASDECAEWKAWQHAVNEVELSPEDVFLSLPATAPLRNEVDIQQVIECIRDTDADVVLTGRKAERSPYFNMVVRDENGEISLAAETETTVQRRQDAPPVYDLTTVAYAVRPQYILSASGLFEGKVRMVEIPKERAVDIDDQIDYRFAQCLHEMESPK